MLGVYALIISFPGGQPWDTQGVSRGLVILGKKTLPLGMEHCASFARNAKLRQYAPTGFVVPWSMVYTAICMAICGHTVFPLQTRFALQTRLMWKIINKIQYHFRAHLIDSILE